MICAVVSFSATAQEKRTVPDQKKEAGNVHDMHDGQHPNNPMKMEGLNLTDAQKAQMKANHEEFQKQMDLLKQNQTMSVKDYNDRKEALLKDQKAKMEALLTPEQKQTLEKQKEKAEADRKEHQEKQLDNMKTKLALSDAQVKQLKDLREDMERKVKAIREDASLNQESRKQKIMELKKTAEDGRNKIFTPEQLKKMEEMRMQHGHGDQNKQKETEDSKPKQ